MIYLTANVIKKSVEEKKEAYKFIKELIGEEKTNAIDDIPNHNMYVRIEIGSRDFERQQNAQTQAILEKKGALTALDKLVITNTKNPKEQALLLAIVEKKFNDKQDQIKQDGYDNQQALLQQQQQGMAQMNQMNNENKIKEIYAKGDVEGKLIQAMKMFEMSAKEQEAILRKSMNKERSVDRHYQKIAEMEAKNKLEKENQLFI